MPRHHRKSVTFFIGVLLSLASHSLLANNSLTILPGATVVVPPSQEQTTVSCTATSTTIVEKFCVCVNPGPNYMKRLNRVYVLSNGESNEVYLGDYSTLAACESERTVNPACVNP